MTTTSIGAQPPNHHATWMSPQREEVFFRSMRVLTVLLVPYATVQLLSWAYSNADRFVSPSIYYFSFVLSVALMGFLIAADRYYRHQLRAKNDRATHRATILVVALLLAFFLVHIHLTGSMNSLHLVLIIAVLLIGMWMMETREIIVFYLVANASLALIVYLEYAGVIAYAPLFSAGVDIRTVFMDWRVVTGTVVNYVILLLVMSGINFRLRDAVIRRAEERQALIDRLEESLLRVKELETLLPVCAWCKRIRTDQGEWVDLEVFLSHHANMTFSHGLCPVCAEKHFDFEGPPKPTT